MAFEPKILDRSPDTGRVLVVNDKRASSVSVLAFAREYLVDIFPTSMAPVGSVYLINIDQIFPGFDGKI